MASFVYLDLSAEHWTFHHVSAPAAADEFVAHREWRSVQCLLNGVVRSPALQAVTRDRAADLLAPCGVEKVGGRCDLVALFAPSTHRHVPIGYRSVTGVPADLVTAVSKVRAPVVYPSAHLLAGSYWPSRTLWRIAAQVDAAQFRRLLVDLLNVEHFYFLASNGRSLLRSANFSWNRAAHAAALARYGEEDAAHSARADTACPQCERVATRECERYAAERLEIAAVLLRRDLLHAPERKTAKRKAKAPRSRRRAHANEYGSSEEEEDEDDDAASSTVGSVVPRGAVAAKRPYRGPPLSDDDDDDANTEHESSLADDLDVLSLLSSDDEEEEEEEEYDEAYDEGEADEAVASEEEA